MNLQLPTGKAIVPMAHGKGLRFEEYYWLKEEDVKRITSLDAMYLQKGDVVLVRSENVESLADHFVVVTGHPIQKPHGLRPQTVSFPQCHSPLLDKYESVLGVTALKLKPEAAKAFLDFHGITVVNGEVVFPNA